MTEGLRLMQQFNGRKRKWQPCHRDGNLAEQSCLPTLEAEMTL